MAGLLYYLAGAKTLGRAELEPLGLLPALGDGYRVAQVMERGPDGGGGLIAAANEGIEDVAVRNHLTRQTWQQIPGKDWWLGFYHDDRPTPADLRRTRGSVAGHAVRLLDAQDWEIPIGEYLPRAFTKNEAGEWIEGPVLPQYADLDAIAERWCNARGKAETTEIDSGARVVIPFPVIEGIEASARALEINYRIGVEEVAMLSLIGNEQIIEVLDALIDLPGKLAIAEALAKKNPPSDTSATDAGPPDSPPDIDPHSPTSGH